MIYNFEPLECLTHSRRLIHISEVVDCSLGFYGVVICPKVFAITTKSHCVTDCMLLGSTLSGNTEPKSEAIEIYTEREREEGREG